MCGIVAYSGKNPFNLDKIKLLMYWNSVERGKDSTGVFTPLNGVIKDSDKAEVFLKKNEIKPDTTFIGHLRAATVGAKTKDNSHPFETGSLIGVHNGTLNNIWGVVVTNGLLSKDYDVDSHGLYAVLDKYKRGETEKVYPKILSTIEGAMALVWWDKDEETLYVYRNDERPLFRGKIDGDIYISSIKESLDMIGCNSVKEFKEEYLYKIKNGEIFESRQNIPKFKAVPKTFNTSKKNKNQPTVNRTVADFIGYYGRFNISTTSPTHELSTWNTSEWDGFARFPIHKEDFVCFKLNAVASRMNSTTHNIDIFVNGKFVCRRWVSNQNVSLSSFICAGTIPSRYKFVIPCHRIFWTSNGRKVCDMYEQLGVTGFVEDDRELSFETKGGIHGTFPEPSSMVPCFDTDDYKLFTEKALPNIDLTTKIVEEVTDVPKPIKPTMEVVKTPEIVEANVEIIDEEEEREEVFYTVPESDYKDFKTQILTTVGKFSVDTMSPNLEGSYYALQEKLVDDLDTIFKEFEEFKTIEDTVTTNAN